MDDTLLRAHILIHNFPHWFLGDITCGKRPRFRFMLHNRLIPLLAHQFSFWRMVDAANQGTKTNTGTRLNQLKNMGGIRKCLH